MRLRVSACLLLAACARAPTAATESIPARVVAIGPGTEANLYALGLGGRLVGVSDFCIVAEAAGLPRVGGQTNPNLERIAALAPDLLLVQGRHPRVEEWSASAGVRFQAFATDSLASWREEVRWLSGRFEVAAEGERLVESVARALSELPAFDAPRRVLLVIARRPDQASGILAAGPGTFLSELLIAAGGVNVMPAGVIAYPSVNEETLISLDPQAVLEFRPGGAADDDALAIWRRSFPEISAARSGRVGTVLHAEALIPGPRMHEVAREMHALLR